MTRLRARTKSKGVGSSPAEGQTVVVSRKCPADAGDVVRDVRRAWGGTAGSNPPCHQRRSQPRSSPPRRSQLNGISPNLRATHPRMPPEFRRAAETACRCSKLARDNHCHGDIGSWAGSLTPT